MNQVFIMLGWLLQWVRVAGTAAVKVSRLQDTCTAGMQGVCAHRISPLGSSHWCRLWQLQSVQTEAERGTGLPERHSSVPTSFRHLYNKSYCVSCVVGGDPLRSSSCSNCDLLLPDTVVGSYTACTAFESFTSVHSCQRFCWHSE